MQKTKRPLSFLLAVLMIVGIFAAVPFTALAVTEGTPLTDQLPSTQGTYYLTQDITISSTWLAPSGATTLDLNGYGIRMTGTGTVIDVCRDASCVLTLNDSRPTYSGGENRPSGILGGYITGGTGSKSHPGTSDASYIVGGGIFVNNAVLNINGGTIYGNSAAWGGGIYINNDCTVNMTGGAITGNSCARGGYGGGVFLSARSTFNVSHTPSIMGNYYSYNGKKYPRNVHMQVVYSGGKPLYAVITIVSPGLTAGAQIGIYEYQTNQYPVTSGYSTYHSGVDPGTYFSCDNAGWAYKVNSEGELLSVPAFTITWLNEDGSLIDTTTVAGGTVPTHADATKDADAQYTYTFAGWNDGTTTYAPGDALPEVEGNATYTATFTRTDREYTITWKNDDGSVIDTTTVAYGSTPTHADATKDADAQYSYTFAGWDKEIVAVIGDATYTATFTTSPSPVALVIEKINAIGTVEYTDASKEKIDAARDAYDLLTDAQKELVINYATLTDAETAYANLKAVADAAADPVSYLVWDDAARKLVEMTGDNACKTYTEVTADTATFEDGMWYVVNGEILNGNRITVTGTSHLILTDGSKLTTNNGINVANGSTLNIYGQGAGTGTVTANGGSNKGAGIGGKRTESGGTVNIYGGTVTATGSGGGAGIGGGWASVGTGGTGGTITIYGGIVTANGSGMGGAGIGGGTSQSAGIVTIYGGTVTANGNNASPGIGPGANGDGGTLTVRGGSVTAVGATKANAINCTVMNTIPGTGWENVSGTGDGTPIAINTEGQELTDFKKVQFLGGASIPNDQQAADAVIAKISAIGTVEYTDASKEKIDAARTAYDELTDAQKELVTNYTTLTAAEARYAELELAQAKTDAKAELANYKDPADYRPAQQTELTNAINAGNAAIDAAADTDAVATALANAKAAIDAIKTDAQLTAEELAAAKRTAKSALLSYKDTHDYRAEQKAELSNAIDDGIAAINAATNTDEVAAALEAAKAVMDAIKTDAQLTAEEELAAAKAAAKAELDNYKNAADYRPAQQTELTNAINAGNDAIDAATTIADVNTALANAKAAIDAIKTDAQLTAEEAAAAAPQDQVSATISDKIEVNFMLDLDKRTDPQTITVAHYKLIDGTNYELIETLTVNAADLTKKGSLYYLTLPVAPAQGADRYVLSIDGEPIAQDIYSVKDYCEYIIANGSNPAYAPYVDLATAMLEYCQAANAYFDYVPVNFAETTNAQAAIDTASGLTGTLMLDENARTYFKTASYMALTVPEYRFYVKEGTLTEAQAAALNSKITVTGPKGVKAQFVKNTDKGDAILLEVTGIDVEHMGDPVTITIKGVGTITFCGYDFARMLAKNNATAVLGAALYNYSFEANKCFGGLE